jgi:hypothetical protein
MDTATRDVHAEPLGNTPSGDFGQETGLAPSRLRTDHVFQTLFSTHLNDLIGG